MTPPGTTWEAVVAIDPDDPHSDAHVLVRRAVPAGVDGPCTPERGIIDLAHADAELRDLGYVRIDPWRTVHAYEGLRLYAAALPRPAATT